MPSTTPQQIDDLMERASRALVATDYFQAEELALRGLLAARRILDFERMARICLPLQEARRQRLQQALDVAVSVRVVNSLPADDSAAIEPGCVLVVPMLVAADARRLRECALSQRVPLAVLCAEPMTQTRLVPIAALGQVVVRTKVRPPAQLAKPSKSWFQASMEALGDAAIDEIDPILQGERRVDAILDRLDAVPDHEKLHQRLADACRAAAHQRAQQDQSGPRSRKPQQVGS
jgi:hypothetical protein